MSDSRPLELDDCSSSSRIHSLAPPDLTGRIAKLDSQYCAAGSFGDVYRCQYHSEFGVKEVAVKTFRFEFTVEEEDRDERSNRMIRRELGIWKRLSHPNIVPFLGTVSGFGRLGNASLVSSWMPNGTLQDFLLKHDEKLTVAHRLQFLLGIANGLHYLHSLLIVHGDLTCNNVLLDEEYNARLADFGYASLVGEIPEALAYLQASTMRPGTVRWAAPEYFFSNFEEMVYCTSKSDIYSFGNVALQVLSGKLPWSEFRRDVVVILHLAKGHKPRRPQSHPIDDQHWGFIYHCWSPVQERPSTEHLVSSVLDFLRSYPHSQPLCDLLVSSEKSNPQSTMSGSLLSPPSTGQFSPAPEVTRTFENLHLMAPNPQHNSNPSTLPLLPQEPLTSVEGDGGNKAASQVGRFQNGSAVNADVSGIDTIFLKRPPPAHSKSGAASPRFLNTSSIGQDPLNIYPFLYPFAQQHSIGHQHSQGTTFGRGDRGAASGPLDGRSGFWGFLSSRFSPYTPSMSTAANRGLSMLRASLPQPSNGAPVRSLRTATSEGTAGASHRRRKQDANFLCPVSGCGSTFTRSFNLKGHMRSHNEERSFQCKWPGCGKGFARQHDRRRHEQLHLNHRPFTCEGCKKTFTRMDALSRHRGIECQRILDASKDLEGLPVPKIEGMGWPCMRDLIPDHVDPSLLPQVTIIASIIPPGAHQDNLTTISTAPFYC